MAELIHGGFLQLKAELRRNNLAAGQNSNILQHLLAAVAEAGRLHCYTVESAAQLVQNQGCERLALNVLGNDDQLTAGLYNLLQQRENFLDIGNLLICNQQIGVVHNGFHFIRVCRHVGADIAAVKHHAFHNLGVCLGGFALFNGDDAVGSDLFHCLGNQLTNALIRSGNRCNTGNVLGAGDFLRVAAQGFNRLVNRLLNALTDNHRVCASRYVLHALSNNGLSHQGRGGGAVAGSVVRFYGNFLYKLCAHILKGVVKLNFLGNGHAVVGNER